jgi:hypothetical protein
LARTAPAIRTIRNAARNGARCGEGRIAAATYRQSRELGLTSDPAVRAQA